MSWHFAQHWGTSGTSTWVNIFYQRRKLTKLGRTLKCIKEFGLRGILWIQGEGTIKLSGRYAGSPNNNNNNGLISTITTFPIIEGFQFIRYPPPGTGETSLEKAILLSFVRRTKHSTASGQSMPKTIEYQCAESINLNTTLPSPSSSNYFQVHNFLKGNNVLNLV